MQSIKYQEIVGKVFFQSQGHVFTLLYPQTTTVYPPYKTKNIHNPISYYLLLIN